MQKARCHTITMLQPLVGVQFQELFTPLFRVLFTFPSRYLFAIGLLGVFSLTRWCWQIQREFHRLPPTQDTTSISYYSFTRLSLSLACLSKQFYSSIISIMQSYNPNLAVTKLVWANPCSLATTWGITFVFSSSRYLDVSVPWVCSPEGVVSLQLTGLPHSDICGSFYIGQSPQLFAAYYVFLRL